MEVSELNEKLKNNGNVFEAFLLVKQFYMEKSIEIHNKECEKFAAFQSITNISVNIGVGRVIVYLEENGYIIPDSMKEKIEQMIFQFVNEINNKDENGKDKA